MRKLIFEFTYEDFLQLIGERDNQRMQKTWLEIVAHCSKECSEEIEAIIEAYYKQYNS